MNILVDATDLDREDAVQAAQAVYLLKTLEVKGLKFLLADDDATDGEAVSFCKPPDAMKAFIKENPEEFERVADPAAMTREEADAHNEAVLKRRLSELGVSPAGIEAAASGYKGPACNCERRPHRDWCKVAR